MSILKLNILKTYSNKLYLNISITKIGLSKKVKLYN